MNPIISAGWYCPKCDATNALLPSDVDIDEQGKPVAIPNAIICASCGERFTIQKIEERYCEIAARRLSQEVLDFAE